MKNERKTLKNVLKWPKPKAQTGHPGAKMVPLPYEIKKKQKKQKSEKNKKMKNSRKIKKKNQPTQWRWEPLMRSENLISVILKKKKKKARARRS